MRGHPTDTREAPHIVLKRKLKQFWSSLLGEVDILADNVEGLPGAEGEERYAALLSNSAAVRAVASAVEGTIGQA